MPIENKDIKEAICDCGGHRVRPFKVIKTIRHTCLNGTVIHFKQINKNKIKLIQ